jgi:hypothetical protein
MYYPELVTGNKDGPELQSINYVGLIPILITDIKNMKLEMNAINNELMTIKNELMTIKNELNEIKNQK